MIANQVAAGGWWCGAHKFLVSLAAGGWSLRNVSFTSTRQRCHVSASINARGPGRGHRPRNGGLCVFSNELQRSAPRRLKGRGQQTEGWCCWFVERWFTYLAEMLKYMFNSEPKDGKFIPPRTDGWSEPCWPANIHWNKWLNLHYVSADVCNSAAIYITWLCFHQTLISTSYPDTVIWFTGYTDYWYWNSATAAHTKTVNCYYACPKQVITHVNSFLWDLWFLL